MIRAGEPSAMTLSDLMAATAGLAVGIAGLSEFPTVLPLAGWVAAGSMAISAAVLVRLIRHGRDARPGEWLAILAAIALLAYRPDGEIGPIVGPTRWGRWPFAGVAGLAIACGLGLVRIGRGWLPGPVRTILLAGLAFLALVGPIVTIHVDGPNLLAFAGGFGGGPAGLLYWVACQRAAIIPLGLMFGVPLIAAIGDRFGPSPRAWTDLAGSVAGLATIAVGAAARRPSIPGFGGLALIERAIDAAWVVAVGLASRWLIAHAVPAWRRWAGTVDRDQASGNIDASPARAD